MFRRTSEIIEESLRIQRFRDVSEIDFGIKEPLMTPLGLRHLLKNGLVQGKISPVPHGPMIQFEVQIIFVIKLWLILIRYFRALRYLLRSHGSCRKTAIVLQRQRINKWTVLFFSLSVLQMQVVLYSLRQKLNYFQLSAISLNQIAPFSSSSILYTQIRIIIINYCIHSDYFLSSDYIHPSPKN